MSTTFLMQLPTSHWLPIRLFASVAFAALLLAGCTRAAPKASGPLSTPAATSAGTASPPAPTTFSTSVPVEVPAGRILFMRETSGGVEHFFTANTDGTDEQALFQREGCGCARWSSDGGLIYTLDATGHGTWSFTTVRPDGTGQRVLPNPMATLNLAPGASSSDGSLVAFWGWDESDPASNGLYAASTELAGLRLVTPVPEGAIGVEPFGITPDGSHIVFFAETGPAGVTHGGDVYVIQADGQGLRKLNPEGTKAGFVGATPSPLSLSPDGRRVAFAAFETSSGKGAVYVADVAGGEPVRVTELAGDVYTVAWSPAGDWIALTTLGTGSSVSLVRPDGTDEHVISPASEDVGYPSFSPDGAYMLVSRGAGERADLWIMDLEGRFIAQVTHEPSSYHWFSWAPDPGTLA